MSARAALRLAVAPREREGRGLAALVLVGSLVAGLGAICVVFAASGVDPFYALYRIFSGSFLWTPSNGTVIKSEFAGVIARDGRLLDIVEKGGGYCTGEVVAKNEIELKYMYDGTPYSIASDSLKRV